MQECQWRVENLIPDISISNSFKEKEKKNSRKEFSNFSRERKEKKMGLLLLLHVS
jgi:hypothetical protein